MAKDNAENLGAVLELARLRRYNGTVLIEHKQSGKVEEGEVSFQAGQPIYARIGRLNGQDALNWIMRWHNITYTLGSNDSSQAVALPVATQGNNTSPLPTNAPANANPSTGPIVSQTNTNGSDPVIRNATTPGIEWLIPQKRGIESEVLALPLTRPQRFIYFLVDGRRTVADLARCTGKNTREIEFILSELQDQGLVAI